MARFLKVSSNVGEIGLNLDLVNYVRPITDGMEIVIGADRLRVDREHCEELSQETGIQPGPPGGAKSPRMTARQMYDRAQERAGESRR